ncbi:MAG: 4Fe-4S dicluster domain-containing protein [Chloroflexi bacterium]|nr:4Fe-4S dicluster domain-containing protein [Chloroflexota bacterium]
MREKGKEVSRRDFIKKTALAAGAVAALSSPLVPMLGKKAKAQEGSHTESKKKRAWAMVIDLKKCDGCVTIDAPPQCTQACVSGHFGPKGQQWIEVYKVESEGGHGSFFMPTPCYQCENAPCTNVCPVAATYHNEDGIVLIDHTRCIGCRLCMAACPYHRRFFNWGTPELPPEAAFAEYSPEYPVPAVKGTVIKCMFCAHFLKQGRLPYCVAGCPMGALYMGDLNEDIGTNGRVVVKLSKFMAENDAFRYKDFLGTQPRVFYLPGHGQEFGRTPNDSREFHPVSWQWGGEGYDKRPGVWPWGGGNNGK